MGQKKGEKFGVSYPLSFFVENVDNRELEKQPCEHMIVKDWKKKHEMNTKWKECESQIEIFGDLVTPGRWKMNRNKQ